MWELCWWCQCIKLAEMSPEVGHPTAGRSPVCGAGLPAAALTAGENLRCENEGSERENPPIINSETCTLLR